MSTYKKVYYFIHYFTNGNIVSGVQFIQADTLSEIRKKWLNYNSAYTSPIMDGIVPKRPKPKLSPEEKVAARLFNLSAKFTSELMDLETGKKSKTKKGKKK
jgi:hypothetical protein